MGEILQFKPMSKTKEQISGKERYKALAKGKVKGFTCNNCGEHFEVYNEDYPKCCPGCSAKIRWDLC